MEFGTLVRGKREELGISLRQAAQAVQVDPAYLSRVEVGKVPPSEQLIGRLASLLDVSEDELLLMCGRLPAPMRAMAQKQPQRALAALQAAGSMMVAEQPILYSAPLLSRRGTTAIEDGFPFEQISEIAEIESWRKEIYRPIYHVHKWWAQRLGSVFRAALLAAAVPRGSSIMDLFYEPVRLPGLVVFDPFMGSGTTVGEAHKLGCAAIGRDINPVAVRSVRAALGPLSKSEVAVTFQELDKKVGKKLRRMYQTTDSQGRPADVLYYFWVKYVACPSCGSSVDLFSSYVFARHAYVRRNPQVQMLCPSCGAVFQGVHDSAAASCIECGLEFDPNIGPARRTSAVCANCDHAFPIAKVAREAGHPPSHRLYAKLVLRSDGGKEYLKATQKDRDAFDQARRKLHSADRPLPRVPIIEGYNTRQILNYGYRYWHELFNERQLLTISVLGQAIRDLPVGPVRDAFAVLFSGVLEFNNMFASYKGEGTGAVRHMFSHHILKPERTPIEANIWGTPKSSGAFSTLYRSRLLRALDYREEPFEVAVDRSGRRKKGGKVYGVSPPMGGRIVQAYPEDGLPPGAIYLSCGDSASTDLPDRSVDLVVTDPPFFDNVHYSELADFFHVWQQLYFGGGIGSERCTTRHPHEVQDVEPDSFAVKLCGVFSECHRVLKDGGLLVFSYHHSREDGWLSVARAVMEASFTFVQSQPVKSELSVAAPKSQAKEPIDLDVLLVCRKRDDDYRERVDGIDALARAGELGDSKISRFNRTGRKLSRNDVKVVLLSQLLVELAPGRGSSEMLDAFRELAPLCRKAIEDKWRAQVIEPSSGLEPARRPGKLQLNLFGATK